MVSNYERGRKFEWDVRDALTEDGYAVARSAGSKTKIDLFAIKRGQILFVQCKRDGKCSPAERARVLELSSFIMEAIPVLAFKRPERGAGIEYRRIVGPGSKDWLPFIPDELSS